MIYSLIFQDHLLEALYTFDTDGCNVSTLHFQISVEIVSLKKLNFVETHYIGSEIGHGGTSPELCEISRGKFYENWF